MANFQKPTAGNTTGWDETNYRVTVGVGRTVDVWLWGGGPGPDFADLAVQPGNSALIDVTSLGKKGQNLRGFTVRGKVAGTTSVRALLGAADYSKALVVVVTTGAAHATQAGRLAFSNVDKCGIAAVDEILEGSIRQGVEFSGMIFKMGSAFGFTAPKQGELDAATPTMVVPPGTSAIGTYHTHGNQRGSGEIFSPQDRAFHNLRHFIGYLGTPASAILKFLPKDRDPTEHPALAAFGGKAITLRSGH